MDLLLPVSIGLLLAWSVYSFMHSRQKAKQKGLLFYSEFIPYLQQYELSKSRSQFPVLSGIYDGYKIKLVPEVDALVLHRLPRLYLRMYIYVPNNFLLRVRKQDVETQSTHFFLPSSFEKVYKEIRLNNQELQLFLAQEYYPLNLETCLARLFPEGNNCAELLLQKNFIRITILLSKGKKSSYVITRATDFSSLIFKREFFERYFQAALELHRELSHKGLNQKG